MAAVTSVQVCRPRVVSRCKCSVDSEIPVGSGFTHYTLGLCKKKQEGALASVLQDAGGPAGRLATPACSHPSSGRRVEAGCILSWHPRWAPRGSWSPGSRQSRSLPRPLTGIRQHAWKNQQGKARVKPMGIVITA